MFGHNLPNVLFRIASVTMEKGSGINVANFNNYLRFVVGILYSNAIRLKISRILLRTTVAVKLLPASFGIKGVCVCRCVLDLSPWGLKKQSYRIIALRPSRLRPLPKVAANRL